jgi:hypothetical protein
MRRYLGIADALTEIVEFFAVGVMDGLAENFGEHREEDNGIPQDLIMTTP